MEEWPDFSSMFGEENRSKRVETEPLSMNHAQLYGFQDDSTTRESINASSSSQNNNFSSRGGGLGERIAARGGFNAPRLNTENFRSNNDFSSLQNPYLTISPGLSPTTLLESPVFYSNPMAQHSPTTGKFPSLPGVNNILKDEFFDDIESSFSFHPGSRSSSSLFQDIAEMHPLDFGSYNNMSSHQFAEDVKPCSQNIESSNLYGVGTDHPSGHNNTFEGTTNTGLETADHQEEEEEEDEEEEEEVEMQSRVELVGAGAPVEDGFNWRKYGQKLVKGSEYPRSYYKCTTTSCVVKKKVERSKDGHVTQIIYKGTHNHDPNPPTRRSGIQVDGTEQGEQRDSVSEWIGGNNNQQNNEDNMEELRNQSGSIQAQTRGQFESSETTFSNAEEEDDRGPQGSASLGYDARRDESESKRRKVEAYHTPDMTGATRAIREPRVVVQTKSEVDILEDGYRWRKYGQKVVKGNPNPRSYYKCTSTGCGVRKHVERASDDITSVITTYEGKHDHDVPVARNTSHGGGGSQSHHNSHHSESSRGRFDRHAPMNNRSLLSRPFSFQPHLMPPLGYSFGLGAGLGNLPMPSLPFVGQGKFPAMPHHYLNPTIGMSSSLLPRGMEPKIEPGLETEQSVYNQIMGRLPHI